MDEIEIFKDPSISDYDLEFLCDVYERNQESLYKINPDEVRRFDDFGTRLL